MVVMSTAHLGIELLDSISLSDGSLVRTELLVNHSVYPHSLLGELVHLLLSIVATSLHYYTSRRRPKPSEYPSCYSRTAVGRLPCL